MNDTDNTYLTPSQFTTILISGLIGVGLMYWPNSIIKYAKQDGWLCCIIGSVYPIYMLIIANYICKKFPRNNILFLSKKCFGNLLGTILNLIFISFLLFMITTELSGLSNIFRTYTTPFLKNHQVFLAVLIPVAYISYKGIKPLGRLNEVLFYITFPLIFISAGTLKYGSFLNLMPVFGSGLMNILSASKETAFSFTGMEIIFLIYPFLQDNSKLLKCGMVCIAFVSATYTWTVFGTIYYLGADISPKYLWPVVTLSDSINIPIINSFRYIFMSLWALIVLKCISVYYFSASYSLSNLKKNISGQTFTLILYPVIFFISLLYGPPTQRRYYTDRIVNFYVIFNIIYVSLIAILISFKKGDNIEKK